MSVGSIFNGKTRDRADRMYSRSFSKYVSIQQCSTRGCETEAAISVRGKHRCLAHIKQEG